jgi:hypothetical protein
MPIAGRILCLMVFFVCATVPVCSQSVQVLKKSDFVPPGQSQGFEFVFNGTDTSRLNYIATIRAWGTPDINRITELYAPLRQKAAALGANCYTFCDYSKERRILTLHVYHANDSILQKNMQLGEKNVIYVFSNDIKKSKTYSFSLNDEKKSIASASYFRHVSSEGDLVKINKGGQIGGSTVWITGKPDKPATFLSIGGLDVSSRPGSNSLYISTGQLQYLESGLAHLLIRLWAPKE